MQTAPFESPSHPPFCVGAVEAAALPAGRLREYARGTIIYMAGEAADRVYWVATGRVSLTSCTEDGREFLLGQVRAGDLFGDVATLLGVPHAESATAAEDSGVYELKRRELEALLMGSPRVSLEMCRRVGSRLRTMQRRLEGLVFRKLEVRVRKALVDVMDSWSPASAVLPLTHQEVANLIGASRQETSRALKRLESDGIIALGYRTITVKSLEELRQGTA